MFMLGTLKFSTPANDVKYITINLDENTWQLSSFRSNLRNNLITATLQLYKQDTILRENKNNLMIIIVEKNSTAIVSSPH